MQHFVNHENELNPFKIGPFLLCYHEEEMIDHSLYKKLHDDLKQRYNFIITNTETNIAESRFLQNKIDSFVENYDNHCIIFSAKSADFFYDDVKAIVTKFLERKKNLSHIVTIKVDNTPINLSRLDFRVKVFDLTIEYNKTMNDLAVYFISVEENSFIRIDLQEYFGNKSIIQVCSFVDSKLFEHFSHNPQELMRIDRRKFEELIAEIFHRKGFDVRLTKRTRDGGYDILAIQKKDFLTKYLIECKRPDIGKKIGIRPVRELYGVKVTEKATKAILATTATFTRCSKLFFEEHKWEIEGKDFSDILEWIRIYNKI